MTITTANNMLSQDWNPKFNVKAPDRALQWTTLLVGGRQGERTQCWLVNTTGRMTKNHLIKWCKGSIWWWRTIIWQPLSNHSPTINKPSINKNHELSWTYSPFTNRKFSMHKPSFLPATNHTVSIHQTHFTKASFHPSPAKNQPFTNRNQTLIHQLNQTSKHRSSIHQPSNKKNVKHWSIHKPLSNQSPTTFQPFMNRWL